MFDGSITGVINEKGGTGKTTVAISLAGAFASLEGYKPYLIDTDVKMGGTKNWFGERKELPFKLRAAIDNTGNRIGRAELQECIYLKHDYHPIIIDSPGHSESDLFEAVIDVSDLVIFVGQPIDTEVKPISNIITSLIIPKNKPYTILFNRVEPTRVDKAKEWQASLRAVGLNVMDNMIRRYIGHSDASRQNKHILEMRGEAAAKRDVEDVCDELMKIYADMRGANNG
jgi:chromosome partitioning protein